MITKNKNNLRMLKSIFQDREMSFKFLKSASNQQLNKNQLKEIFPGTQKLWLWEILMRIHLEDTC
jgi:hypothetical protein